MISKHLIIPALYLLLIGVTAKIAAQTDTWTEAKLVTQPSPVSVKGTDTTGVYGLVSIKASIDKEGNVFAAEFAESPGSSCHATTNIAIITFREAARQAAMKAKFIPAKRNNEPMFSTVILTYEFSRLRTEKPSESKVEARVDSMAQPGTTIRPSGDTAEDAPNNSSAGVLNGKAISLVKPVHPQGAKIGRLVGPVVVKILVDEDGTVLAAEPVSGPSLLQASARSAACKARFSPTLLSGRPVKISGIITYGFAP